MSRGAGTAWYESPAARILVAIMLVLGAWCVMLLLVAVAEWLSGALHLFAAASVKAAQVGALAVIALPGQLPAIGQPWPGVAGVYAGITTGRDGVPYALVVLDAKPASSLTWRKAINWAKGLDAELPNRVESALLFANVPENFEKRWHWTSEQFSAGSAWVQYVTYGSQDYSVKSLECLARAVRRFTIQSFSPLEAA
jgi:hypothetical protein